MTEDLNELIAEYRAARAQEKAKGAVFAAVVGKYFAALDDHRKAGEYRHSVGEKLLDALDVDAPRPATEAEAAFAEPVAEPVADAEFFLSQAAQSMERGDAAAAEMLRADALEAALPGPEVAPLAAVAPTYPPMGCHYGPVWPETVSAEKHGIDKETDASIAALAEAKKASDAYIAAMTNGAPREERVRLLQEADGANERYLDSLVAGTFDEPADDVLKAAAPVDQPEPAFSAAEPEPAAVEPAPVLCALGAQRESAWDECFLSLTRGSSPAQIDEKREAYFQADEAYLAARDAAHGTKSVTERQAYNHATRVERKEADA